MSKAPAPKKVLPSKVATVAKAAGKAKYGDKKMSMLAANAKKGK